MKKGFTLIELLGVIVILGILVLIAFPPLLNQIKKSKSEIKESTKLLIIDAAKDYVNDNENNYEKVNGNIYCINISTLTENNYLNENLKTEDLDNLDTSKKVKLTYKNTKFEYEIVKECETSHETEITNAIITKEIENIRSKINATVPDGVYYYNGYGNLERDADIIYTNSDEFIRGNILVHNHQFISGCLNYGSENYDIYKTTVTPVNYKCPILRGENLFVNGDMSYGDNTNFSTFTYNNEGYLSYTTSATGTIMSDIYIPIDPMKSYKYGVTAKTTNPSTKVYISYIPYDVDHNQILVRQVIYLADTLTTLAKDLKKGDRYVYLTDMTNWNTTTTYSYRRGFIFWNYVDSTGYAYPELTYSRNIWYNLYDNNSETVTDNIEINKEIDGEIVNRIKLKNTWNRGTIPAGTKLSQSDDGSTYPYALLAGGYLSTDWANKSATLHGTGGDKSNHNKFRYGQTYMLFGVNPNSGVQENVTAYFKDIYLREIIN